MLEDHLDKFEFFPQALDEYLEASRYYERQQAGLGERFDFDVVIGLQRIIEHPRIGTIFDGEVLGIRKCITRTFRFHILYFVDEKSIKIVALSHPDREPRYWAKRLG